MSQSFSRSGIRFEYPANWKLETDETSDGWSATVNSPATAFIMVSCHPNVFDPVSLADDTLNAMKESYPELESETKVETIADRPAIGHDLNFFAFDLTNSCTIRCVAFDGGCLLILAQCTDEELPSNGLLLQAIRGSLTIEDND